MRGGRAGVSAALGVAFFSMVGRPDTAEIVAFAGLMVPGLLALLALAPISLSVLEQIGLASFAALIGYLAVLTGGVVSPLLVWLALVPAEAALSGAPNNSRSAVLRAGIVASGAVLARGGHGGMGVLPPSPPGFSRAPPRWGGLSCPVVAG